MKHIPHLSPLSCAPIEPVPAELYTADDPNAWLEAMRDRYGPNFDSDAEPAAYYPENVND